jgi:hypothetical protein
VKQRDVSLGRRSGGSLEAAGVAPAEHDHLAFEDVSEVRRLLALGDAHLYRLAAHGVLTQYQYSTQSHHQSAQTERTKGNTNINKEKIKLQPDEPTKNDQQHQSTIHEWMHT